MRPCALQRSRRTSRRVTTKVRGALRNPAVARHWPALVGFRAGLITRRERGPQVDAGHVASGHVQQDVLLEAPFAHAELNAAA